MLIQFTEKKDYRWFRTNEEIKWRHESKNLKVINIHFVFKSKHVL